MYKAVVVWTLINRVSLRHGFSVNPSHVPQFQLLAFLHELSHDEEHHAQASTTLQLTFDILSFVLRPISMLV